MLNNVALVRMEQWSEYSVSLRITDAAKGKSKMILITKEALKELIDNGHMAYSELNNFVKAYRCNEGAEFTVYFVSLSYDDELRGYRRSFSLPISKVIDLVEGKDLYELVDIGSPLAKSRIVLTDSAHEKIGKMNKYEKRAFSKALRNHFTYGASTTITVGSDFGRDFWFVETNAEGKRKMNGGLCFSKTTRTSRNGNYYKGCQYTIHT